MLNVSHILRQSGTNSPACPDSTTSNGLTASNVAATKQMAGMMSPVYGLIDIRIVLQTYDQVHHDQR